MSHVRFSPIWVKQREGLGWLPNPQVRFKAQDNVFKVYHSKRSPKQVREFAARCQQERLNNPTLAEDRMDGLLRGIGVDFVGEHAIFHSDDSRFIIVDFWIKNHKVAIECDGAAVHDLQKGYDAGRDAFLASHGVKTYRFSNAEILKTPNSVAERIGRILGC